MNIPIYQIKDNRSQNKLDPRYLIPCKAILIYCYEFTKTRSVLALF